MHAEGIQTDLGFVNFKCTVGKWEGFESLCQGKLQGLAVKSLKSCHYCFIWRKKILCMLQMLTKTMGTILSLSQCCTGSQVRAPNWHKPHGCPCWPGEPGVHTLVNDKFWHQVKAGAGWRHWLTPCLPNSTDIKILIGWLWGCLWVERNSNKFGFQALPNKTSGPKPVQCHNRKISYTQKICPHASQWERQNTFLNPSHLHTSQPVQIIPT